MFVFGRLEHDHADALDALEKRVKELKLILEAIRDSTHVSAVVLRGLAARELEKK